MCCCLAGAVTAEEPPQPYLEEPHYEIAPHLLGSEDGFRGRLADAGLTILADNTGFYWNFDQLLFVDPADATRGWGPFGRAGIADPDTSPLDAFQSFGFGGSVPSRTRRDDTSGVGWYWASVSSQIGTAITSQFGPIGDGQGIECFYNYAVTPAIRITPDLQYVVPSLRSASPALIAGVRALVSF
ncbi:MAG: carbohydrate porin [Planctomycetia bacterium]